MDGEYYLHSSLFFQSLFLWGLVHKLCRNSKSTYCSSKPTYVIFPSRFYLAPSVERKSKRSRSDSIEKLYHTINFLVRW